MEKSTARSLSVFRLIPEQFQTNKVHDTSKIGQKKITEQYRNKVHDTEQSKEIKKKRKKNPTGGMDFCLLCVL
jgi:hypothetical protein